MLELARSEGSAWSCTQGSYHPEAPTYLLLVMPQSEGQEAKAETVASCVEHTEVFCWNSLLLLIYGPFHVSKVLPGITPSFMGKFRAVPRAGLCGDGET